MIGRWWQSAATAGNWGGGDDSGWRSTAVVGDWGIGGQRRLSTIWGGAGDDNGGGWQSTVGSGGRRSAIVIIGSDSRRCDYSGGGR